MRGDDGVTGQPSFRPVVIVALLLVASLVAAAITTHGGRQQLPAQVHVVVIAQRAAESTSFGSIAP